MLLDIRDRQPTGISRYAIGLLRVGMRYLDRTGVEIGVLCEGHQVPRLDDLSSFQNVTILESRRPELFVRFDDAVLAQIVEFGPDHYHSFSNFADPRVPCPWSVTIHDLIRVTPGLSQIYSDSIFLKRYGHSEYENLCEAVHYLNETVLRGQGGGRNSDCKMGDYLDLVIQSSAERSAFILTPSKSTKMELRKRVGDLVPIFVEAPRLDTAFFEETPADMTARSLDQPFFLFVGTPGMHKRLDLVEEYLSTWPAERGEAPDLVVVGDRVGGNLYERIPTPLAKGDRVSRRGYVDDVELRRLYQAATALVMPSVSEGYGLPADEALACGGKVIASRISVLTSRLPAERVRFFDLFDRDSFLAAAYWALGDGLESSHPRGYMETKESEAPVLLKLLNLAVS